MIQSFNTLTTAEQAKLYALIREINPDAYPDEATMRKAYLGVPYEQGETQLSYWEDGEVLGALALVTKEIPSKGEAFIHAVFISPQRPDVFQTLLTQALAVCPAEGLRSTKLGLPPGRADLPEVAEILGFKEAYAMLELAYGGKSLGLSIPPGFQTETLTSVNKSQFKEIINAAFENTQNGAILTDAEVDDLVEDNAKEDRMGLCLLDEVPFGVYQLEVAGAVGWVDTIGIHPKHQGRGLGRLVLAYCLERLKGMAIKLKVVSTNHRALSLYRGNGFDGERTIGVWFEK